MSNLRIGQALVGITVLYAGAANATVLQTQTLSYSQLLSGASFSLFNSTLGTLTEVIVTSTPTLAYTASVTNNGASAVTGTFNLYMTNTFTSSQAGLINALYSGSGFSFFDLFSTNVGLQTGQPSGNPLLSFTSPTITVAAAATSPTYTGTLTSTYTYDSTSGLSVWGTNGATQTITLAETNPTNGNFSTAGGGTTFTSVNLSSTPGGGLTIQYIGNVPPPPPPPPPPTGTPEPASMALLGAGLLGLGTMVRRKRRT